MLRLNRLILATAMLALATPPIAMASFVTVTFDEPGLVHGSIVSGPSGPFIATHGLTITADNARSGGPDIAIAFDSRRTDTRDPDLEGPPPGSWSYGNLAPDTWLGNLIVIAENAKDRNNDGVLDKPDDEGRRPAGSIVFDFDTAINSIGFDLIDIEGPEFGDDAGFVTTFFMGGTALGSIGFGEFLPGEGHAQATDVVYGENSANRIAPISASAFGATTFDRVEFNLGGSGAIDNVTYTHVPEPASLLIWLGLGLIAFARRR